MKENFLILPFALIIEGAVFGGIAFIELLCGLLGHIIFNPIYSATQSQGHPSLVYLIMGAINLAGVTIMMYVPQMSFFPLRKVYQYLFAFSLCLVTFLSFSLILAVIIHQADQGEFLTQTKISPIRIS